MASLSPQPHTKFPMKKLYVTLLLVLMATTAMAQTEEGITVATAPEAQEAEELTPNEARKRRGVTTDDVFVPRGQWIFGGTASYTTHRNKDYKLLIIDGINSDGYSVSVSPMLAYAPYKNMAVGIRFGYDRSLLALDGASVSFADASLDIDMLHQLKHTYTGTLFWRPYIPLGHTNRFALFAEVQLNFSMAQSKIVAKDGMVDSYPAYNGTYTKKFGGSLGVQPGLMAFVTNNTALEVSIGVFSIGYNQADQIRNQVDMGTTKSSNMSFNVNFLSIGFGVSFYL